MNQAHIVVDTGDVDELLHRAHLHGVAAPVIIMNGSRSTLALRPENDGQMNLGSDSMKIRVTRPNTVVELGAGLVIERLK